MPEFRGPRSVGVPEEPTSPALALGMVASAPAVGRRAAVRHTMLSGDLADGVAFRFLLGSVEAHRTALREEQQVHGDLLLLRDALDGGDVSIHCSCIEKMHLWFVHALKRWPDARWVGKTEDDTYTNLPQLLFDLRRPSVLSHSHLVYGLMHLTATAPIMPAGVRPGCWLADLESVYGGSSPAANAAPWQPEASLAKHIAQAKRCNGSIAPFPSGPLAVFSAALARRRFVGCDYLRDFMQIARAWDRASDHCGTDHPNRTRGLAGTTCDGVLGGWIEHCTPRGEGVVLAHMTWSKGHFFADRPGGLGWVLPSNTSVAVHGIKSSPETIRSNGRPEGAGFADWKRTHELSSVSRRTPFPPLLWRYAPTRTASAHGAWSCAEGEDEGACAKPGRAHRTGNWSLLDSEVPLWCKP